MSDDTVKDLRRGVFWMHDAVIDEMLPVIGPDALLLYTLFCRRANAEGQCFPKLASLAEGFGWGKNRVIAALTALKAAGMVAIEERRKGQRQSSNLYQLLDPTSWNRPGYNGNPTTQSATLRAISESPAETLESTSESSPESLGTRHEGIHSTKGIKKLSSRVAAVAAEAPSGPTKEQRNALWDAIARAHYTTPPARYTKGEAADLGRTVKELLEVGATPRQVADFKAWWERKYRGAPFTHRCLRQHWGSFLAECSTAASTDQPAGKKSVAELADRVGKPIAEVWALIQARGLTEQYEAPQGLA